VARGDRHHPPLRPSSAFWRWAPVVVVLALFGGAAAAYHYDWSPFDSAPSATPRPVQPAPDVPGLTLAPLPATVAPVADPASSAKIDRSAVRRALAPGIGNPHLASLRAVVAPLTGAPVYERGRGLSMPASTLKLLTTTAALDVLGPDHTFSTTVVASGRGRITLVGGGDPFLASRRPAAGTVPQRASLQALARQTATALHAKHVKRVRLDYDTSLFTGPTSSPHWPASYLSDGVVAPITALWADEGSPADGTGKVADPPAAAASYFAGFLAEDGIAVQGTARDRTAKPGAHELARVTSAPLSDIVERVLEVSDNEGAEVIAHQLGIAVDGQGSFAGGVRAVKETLNGLGIRLHGARLYDGSGLSRADRVDADTLVQVLQLDASTEHPELRSIVTGLPVAGFSGSLDDRFDGSSARGAGWVRAKTGTLTGTSAIAGLTTDARGRPMVFAFVSNDVPLVETLDARAALDDLAGLLAGCRC
jgi:D-alanyl-D-alanine carboxypeptidase/D-alanyl-D-alanine-endopeptidase (penicillin-binding protein 4)